MTTTKIYYLQPNQNQHFNKRKIENLEEHYTKNYGQVGSYNCKL